MMLAPLDHLRVTDKGSVLIRPFGYELWIRQSSSKRRTSNCARAPDSLRKIGLGQTRSEPLPLTGLGELPGTSSIEREMFQH